MRIGITGHQRLKEPSSWKWVSSELDSLLAQLESPLIGITSLAIGADQLFANAVLRHGGSLEAVIPFTGYENTFSEGHDKHEYTRLLNSASKVEILEKRGSDEEAYLEAGKRMIDLSDILVAVWDGKPAAGLGGTGDAVNYALQKQRKVIHLNPITHKVIERSREA
jgi:hypothetical protein